MKRVILAISAAVFGLTVAVALAFAPIVQPSAATTASAQTVVIDQSPECGAMVNGQWTPNGQCREFADCGAWANDVWSPSGTCQNAHLRLSGTITAVNGSMVTIQQAGVAQRNERTRRRRSYGDDARLLERRSVLRNADRHDRISKNLAKTSRVDRLGEPLSFSFLGGMSSEPCYTTRSPG